MTTLSVETARRAACAVSLALLCACSGDSGSAASGVEAGASGGVAGNTTAAPSGGTTRVQAGRGGAAAIGGGDAGRIASAVAGHGESGANGAAGTSTTSAGAGGSAAAGMGGARAGAGANAAGAGGTPSAAAGTSSPSGGASAPASKKFVGNITTSGQVRSDFSMYWDQITPENEGKWGSVEATRNQMNWSGLDRIHDYAVANHIVFKQHNFVWGSQQPSWLSGLPADQQKAEVEEWIRSFCERYPDVALIDVVNEPPPHTMPVYMDALGGAGSSGYDWIVQAFKWARQYCPKAILILNDYNNIEYDGDNSHFLDIVNRIKSAGAPIDALGAQAHDAYKLPLNTVQGFLDKLTATGLPVYITEYDINLSSDADQEQIMQTQFPLFWMDDKVAGITLWGYVVGATWKPDTGLLTSAGMQRPALMWLMKYLNR